MRDADAACGGARSRLEATPSTSRALLATSLQCLGEARLAEGDLAGASALLERALQLREAAVGTDHPWVAETLTAQRVLGRQQQTEGAKSVLQRARRIREKKLGPRHPALAETVQALADLRASQVCGRHNP